MIVLVLQKSNYITLSLKMITLVLQKSDHISLKSIQIDPNFRMVLLNIWCIYILSLSQIHAMFALS